MVMISPQPVARRGNNPGFHRGLLHAHHRFGLGGHLGRLGRRRFCALAGELGALAKHGRAQVVSNGGGRIIAVTMAVVTYFYSRKLR